MIAINNSKQSQPQLSTFTIATNKNNNSSSKSQPTSIGHPGGKTPTTAAATPAALDLSPPDFDFNLPCRYFKSSFARSLSLNSGASNQSKSMDYIGSSTNKSSGFQAAANAISTASSTPSPAPMVNRKCSTDLRCNEVSRRNSDLLAEIPVPPIPARRQNIETSAIIPTASVVNGSSASSSSSQHLLRNSCGSNTTNRVTTAINGSGNGGCNNSATGRLPHVPTNGGNGNSHFVRRNVCWPPSSSSVSSSSSSGLLSSGEQESSQLLDETEHELKLNGDYPENRFEIVDTSPNVEAVILQNQVDTLQWQLKQAETSCGMYRAVMEEVARFLERFQKNSACSRSEQISRSKSMYHVYSDADKGSDSGNSSVYPRARSSTNLIDLKRMSPSSCGGDSTKSGEEDHYDLASPIDSTYSTFKDFTWRRSPKKRAELKFNEEAEEKLTKEAFRLSRTIHNLLHTQQPDLTQHRQSLSSRVKSTISSENMPPDAAATHQKANLTAEMLFLRTINMRDSRLSLRSSTDSSVHSTSSSSKIETDEENYSPPLLGKQCANLCSTTEDESGFSSISSFQEIGVPLCSTMISSSTSSSHLDDSIDQSDYNLDSRNSTLKAGGGGNNGSSSLHTASIHANNVGLPLSHDANRWDSKTYRKNKFQRFSTLSNEDSSTVLWV